MAADPLRVLVVGAGSLGSVYSGALAAAGARVQMLAREAHARAITDSGELVVDGPSGPYRAAVRATADPREVEDADIAIVLVKAQDTRATLESLDHVSVSVAVSLQNGIDLDGVVADWATPGTYIAGVSMVGGSLVAPGHVRHTLEGPTFLGSPGDDVGLVGVLADLLRAKNFEAIVTPRIRSVEWSKLVHGAPAMGLTCLTRVMFHELFVNPGLRELVLEQLLEGIAIAEAAGVELDDWPSLLPLKTLRGTSRRDALDLLERHGDRLVASGSTSVRISMLQSLETGRPLEIENVFGVLVRTAEEHAIEAPITSLTHRILSAMNVRNRTNPDVLAGRRTNA